MDRRRVLAAVGTGVTALAGCVQLTGPDVPDNSTAVELPYGADGPSANVEHPVRAYIRNADDSHQYLILTVREGDGAFSESERRLFRLVYSLASGDSIRTRPLIEMAGLYTLTARTLEGRATEYEWRVSPYKRSIDISISGDGTIAIEQLVN